MKRLFVLPLLVAFAGANAGGGPSASEVDGFDTDTENWTNGGAFDQPVRIPSGGPGGAADAYLQFSSSPPMRAQSKQAGAKGVSTAPPFLVMFNRMQWTGDYSSTGSGPFVFSMDVNNTGSNPVMLRLAIGSGTGMGGTWYVTDNANAVSLAAASGWSTQMFSTEDLVLAGDSSGSATLATVLSGVASIRILHSPTENYGPGIGDPNAIVGEVGVDNIQFSQVPVELQQFSVE